MDPTTDNQGQPDVNGGNQNTNEAAGNGGFNFNSALNSEYLAHPSIQKFNGDVNNLAKSYLSLEQLMGQGRVAIPKDGNDAVAWEAYDKAFGVPAKDQDYNLKAKDGFNYDKALFTKLMRDNHISPTAAQNILNAFSETMEEIGQSEAAAVEQQKNATVSALKGEWGAKYNQNMELANNTLVKLCESKEDYDHILNIVGNDATCIKFLNKIGSITTEGNLGGFEGQVSGFSKTPSEAKAEFDRIMNDPDDAYWAGSRNRRNDVRWCKEHNATYVSEDERKARVQYVQSLMRMQG